MGHADRASLLETQAETLRRQFEDAFWCEEIGTYALALDGAKRQCRVRTSNAGHALFSGIAAEDRAARVAATLMDAHVVFRLGDQDAGHVGSPLQPDVLP